MFATVSSRTKFLKIMKGLTYHNWKFFCFISDVINKVFDFKLFPYCECCILAFG